MWVVVIIYCYFIYQFKTKHIYYLIAPVGGESLWSIVELSDSGSLMRPKC